MLTLPKLNQLANKALDRVKTSKNLKELLWYNKVHSRLFDAMVRKMK